MNGNIKQAEDNTEEILTSITKLLSNNDDEFLSRKFLKPYDLNIKKKEIFLDDDMIPITCNSMFKTMIYNDNRIKYSKYLLDFLPERYVDFTLIKSEIDKDIYEDKEMVVDFIAIKEDLIINMEMNMSNKLERNANYLYRLCSKEIKKGSEYKFLKGLQININGFKPPHNKIVDLYYTRDKVGNVFLPQIFVNIYLQNLWDLYYNVDIEKLSKFERWLLVMTSESKSEAEKLANGDEKMEEYIKDAKDAIINDKSLREAYDHEAELCEIARENGREEGREEGIVTGIKKGEEKKSVEIVQEMKKQGFSLEQICSIVKIPMDKLSSWML